MRSLIFLFLAITLLIAFQNSTARAQVPKVSEITEISLSYSGSHFAASSGFTIVLRKDGTATFSGAKNSSRAGDYVGTFNRGSDSKRTESYYLLEKALKTIKC